MLTFYSAKLDLKIYKTQYDDALDNLLLLYYRNCIALLGFDALSGKNLLVRIVENNKIDDYFRGGQVK